MKRENLIAARGDKKQEEVAKVVGISQKSISKLELGKRNPSSSVLGKITTYYNKTAEELFPDIFLQPDTPKGRES